jgi:hypothetical protein
VRIGFATLRVDFDGNQKLSAVEMKLKKRTTVEGAATNDVRVEVNKAHLRPAQLAARWGWHVESIRRALRQRRIDSIIIGRTRLIPLDAVLKVEAEGFIRSV